MNGEGIETPKSGASARRIRDMYADIKLFGYSSRRPFAFGRVEKRMQEFAERNGITLASKSIYIGPHSIAHTLRDKKVQSGNSVPIGELIKFPKSRRSMDLYFDRDAFVYTDYKYKYIIHPSYTIKLSSGRVKKVNFITATKVKDRSEFLQKRYQKVE